MGSCDELVHVLLGELPHVIADGATQDTGTVHLPAAGLRVSSSGYPDTGWTDGSTGDMALVIEHGAPTGYPDIGWLVVGGTVDGVATIGQLVMWEVP